MDRRGFLKSLGTVAAAVSVTPAPTFIERITYD